MTQGTHISVPVPMQYIQSIRLVHALAESSYTVAIPREHTATFRHLSKMFALSFSEITEQTRSLPDVSFSHETPSTTVGRITRPLLFPQGAFEYCRQRWSSSRPCYISFAGLVTDKRRLLLENWLQTSAPALRVMTKRPASLSAIILCQYRNAVAGRRPILPELGLGPSIDVCATRRGRRFPVKTWDQEYYGKLAQTCFALCPDGDFVWTYRFFEAIMCGAIPVIENTCVQYDGFTFYHMNDACERLEWSPEIAEHNFFLCKERLTVAREELDAEISALLQLE